VGLTKDWKTTAVPEQETIHEVLSSGIFLITSAVGEIKNWHGLIGMDLSIILEKIY
jgi:hypothetical protein